jgi:hypothetical protein
MIKIVYRTLISLTVLLLIIVAYFSIIGVKTDKFNSKIISQVKKIEPNLEIKLNKVSAKFNPFKFEISTKTIGTDLIYRDKIIKLESIKSNISLMSYLSNNFAITNIFVSTKPLVIKDLITFARLFNNDPKIFIAKKFIKKGYVVADLKLEFDNLGNIKNNYKINGKVNNGKISLFKKYNLNEINFIFEINEKYLKFIDTELSLNNKNILMPEFSVIKKNKEFLVSGKLITNDTSLSKNDIKNLMNNELQVLGINEILFSSKNIFKFNINKNFKFKNLDIKSDIDLNKVKLKNFLKLKSIFPQIKKDILFKNQKIKLEYEKDNLSIVGEGGVLIQNKIDKINYRISKTKDKVMYNATYIISKNPFELNLLNYEKNKNSDLQLNFKSKQNIKEKFKFYDITLKEKNNFISIKNLSLSDDNKINEVDNIDMNYTDKENLINRIEITKNNQDYLVSGKSFNIDSLVEKLLDSKNDEKIEFFNKNLKLVFDVEKIYLDKNNTLNDLKGFLFVSKNKISELNLESSFPNQKNIKFTIKDNGKEKITTLFSQEAKPLVERYKFIKGFEEGDLDFYSIKKSGITNSTIKIDNFKVQEIPVLAKLLTLASLQGIADLLTGEGIRFTDFEMKFSSKGKLMTIEELYAIGPAISILMDGYIESKKLISLRGTLVPATTVNRTISSIPIIGDILVGKKVGEGVFGVSFKIKGHPKDLETTVNPIKTLTPRFITRTLEKIKN